MTATPVPSPAASGTSGAVFSDPSQLLTGLGIVLAFGLLAMVIVLAFILLAQDRQFDTVEFLARRGLPSTSRDISATIPAVAAKTGAAAQPEVKITGPDRIIVGEPADYAAAEQDGKKAPVFWSVAPSDTAKVEPTTAAAQVKVTVSKPGPVAILAARAKGEAPVVLAVTAEKAASSMTVLGAIGAGWGSIVVSIAVAAVVAALGIAGVLDGQAIAGIYGALIGYLFGFQLQSSGSSGSGNASTTSGS